MDGRAMSEVWAAQPRRLVVVVAVVVAVQVLVPTLMLIDGQQNRFGWQMYAGRAGMSSLVPVDADGQTVDVAPWSASLRPEVSWPDVAPAAVCARDDRVASIRFTFSDGTQREVPCP